MTDDMLSQEEINALLSGVNNEDDTDKEEESPSSSNLQIENYLSTIEQDALGEIGNISFGSSATALSSLLNQKVEITTPTVTVVDREELEKEFPKPHVAVSVHYTEGFEGMNLLVIKTSDAAIIADLMLGNDGTKVSEDLTEMELSAVQEAMNQMMGSASTSMSTIFNKRVDISPPGIDFLDLKNDPDTDQIPDNDILVQVSFNLQVGELIDSQIMQLFTITFAKDMVEQLMNPEQDSEPVPEDEIAVGNSSIIEEEPVAQQDHKEIKSGSVASPTVSAPISNERQAPQHVSTTARESGRTADIQPAALSNFEVPTLGENEARNLDMLLDIPLEVTVELGRTKRSIKDILEFAQGSIIELDKLAGEPVEILVNQQLIAKGEVVVIDENFGVRVTDIVSETERLHKIR